MPIVENKEFIKFCRFFQLKHIESGYLKGNDWKHSSLKAPYHRLYIVVDGEGILFLEKRKQIVKKGHAYIIPANTDFTCDSPVYIEKLYVHFVADNMFMMDPFEGTNTIFEEKIDIYPYEQIVKNFIEKNYDTYFHIKATYENQIYSMIDRLTKTGQLKMDKTLNYKLVKLNEIMTQYIAADLKISWLATQMGMSSSTLSKFYKKKTGKTIKRTITEKIIKKAQILLLTTELNICEIADELGYKDPLYMTKVFTEVVGIPPTIYRKRNIKPDVMMNEEGV